MTVLPEHDHTHKDAENHEHIGKFSYRHTHVLDPENRIHDHEKFHQTNIEKYLDEVLSHEKEAIWKDLNYDKAKELLANKEINGLTEDQVRALIVYSTFTYCVNNMVEPEMMYICELAVSELKRAGSAEPVSNMFINSLFNFRNIYRPIYDLLDIRYGNRIDDPDRNSDQYRLGVIDAILTLRKYERSTGFGWEDPYPRTNLAVSDQLELEL
jgi:hypothetical protein